MLNLIFSRIIEYSSFVSRSYILRCWLSIYHFGTFVQHDSKNHWKKKGARIESSNINEKHPLLIDGGKWWMHVAFVVFRPLQFYIQFFIHSFVKSPPPPSHRWQELLALNLAMIHSHLWIIIYSFANERNRKKVGIIRKCNHILNIILSFHLISARFVQPNNRRKQRQRFTLWLNWIDSTQFITAMADAVM